VNSSTAVISGRPQLTVSTGADRRDLLASLEYRPRGVVHDHFAL